MRRLLPAVAAAALLASSVIVAAPAAHAGGLIQDDNLAACIQSTMETIGLTVGGAPGEIVQSDVDQLGAMTEWDLDCSAQSVTTLAGIEALQTTELQTLILNRNAITDMSPLDALTSLQYVNLSFNSVDTPVALPSLTNLTVLFLDGNQITDVSALAGMPPADTRYLRLFDNHIADLSALGPDLCTSDQQEDIFANPDSPYKGQCIMVMAPFQTLTSTAAAGAPVALPAVTGQVGDDVVWSVMDGAAVLNADGTVTYPAAGTYVLQFQDQVAANSAWLLSDNLSDAATCALQGGTWGDPGQVGYDVCSITAEFSGIVTVTVTAAPAPESTTGTSVDAGGTVATSPLPVAALLVLAGLGLALRARRTA